MRKVWLLFVVAIILSLFVGADVSVQNGSVVIQPQVANAQYYQVVEKRCGNCNKVVPNDSQVGDRCPHCGVIWGMEQTQYGGTVSGGYDDSPPPEPEPEGEDISVKVMPNPEDPNDKEESLDTVYREKDDALLVPLRDILRVLHAWSEWDPDPKPPVTVVIHPTGLDALYTLTIGKTLVGVNECGSTREVEFEVAPITRKGICYVSLIDIATLFGFTVELSEDNSLATLTPVVPEEEAAEETTSTTNPLLPRIKF